MTTMHARNPLTGADDYSFEVADATAVAAACATVRAAQPGWAALGVDGRAAALRSLAAAFGAHRAALQRALEQDTGRHRIASIEALAVDGMIEAAIANATVVHGQTAERASMIPGVSGRTQLLPYPVVGVIAPWNFPLILSMIDLIPALAAGCGVVLKPSEVTPRYVDPLRLIFDAVPALRDVVRIVRGPGSTGAALIDCVDAVVCTGSVRTGRLVAEHASRRFIPAFLELGGKDPDHRHGRCGSRARRADHRARRAARQRPGLPVAGARLRGPPRA
jgi:succinate-semialdehyde dehydrogenase / glutarate-semialdehyde dehydrogenase